MDSPYGRTTDSGQPTEGGPGARARADLGLPVHRQTRAVSPQSELCTCNRPTNLEAGTGPARRACKEPHSDPGPSRRAILTLPGPVLSGPGSARHVRQDRARGPGTAGRAGRYRVSVPAALWAAPSHAQAVPDPPLSVHRSPEPAAVRGTAGMDSENPAQASKANHSGPRRITQPGTGARNRELRVSHTLAR
jgi:hypothetical protein